MKSLRLVVISMVFAAVLTVSAMAQAAPKVVFIDSEAFFDEKAGITKVINGLKRLDTEMKPRIDERNTKAVQYNTLKKSYDTLVDNATKNIPVDTKDLQAKQDQLQTLGKEITRMDEDNKAQREKRMFEIMQPINQEIAKSIQDFSKQKGYTLVMDIARLLNAGVVLYAEESTDVTKEFITFYNTAKPAGTATK